MAIAVQKRRSQTNIFLTLKILQFVHQLRRRVKPRFACPSISGSEVCLGRGSKAIRSFAKGLPRAGLQHKPNHSNHASDGVCESRNTKQNVSRPRLKLRTTGQDDAAIQNISGGEMQHVLDSVEKLSPSGSALSAVARSNEMFLRQSAMNVDGLSLNDIAKALIRVHDAISVLGACRSQHDDEWLIAQGLDAGLVFDGTFLANYEHLLFRLQSQLVGALERKVLDSLLLGGHDKKQHRLLSWFTEFAEKPRPLSTFPWTIKPSLAVLWGVCWMFYNGDNRQNAQRSNPRVPLDAVLQNVELPSWNPPSSMDYLNFGLELVGTSSQPEAQQLVGGAGNRGLGHHLRLRNTPDPSVPCDLEYAPQRQGSVLTRDATQMGTNRQGSQGNGLSTYSSPFPAALGSFNSDPTNFLPNIPGNATDLTVFPQQLDDSNFNSAWQRIPPSSLPQQPARHLTSAQAPSIRITGSADSAAPHPDFASFEHTLYQAAAQEPQAPPLNLNTSNLDNAYSELINHPFAMGNETSPILSVQSARGHERTSSIHSISNFPTPVSIGGSHSPLLSPVGDRRHSTASSLGPMRHVSEDRSSVSQDGDDHDSPRRNHAYKRSEEPPRNHEGKMVCKHGECTGLAFDRKCEWSKHMDKHDRPYKCAAKGCEKLQGFTYSGGLLRHEREVHKMHGGTKKSLFCPFADCKRSSGSGFTRKENLAEHIRRVHRRTSMSADLGHLIIRRADSIDENSLNDMRMPSESLFPRIPEVPAEEDAHNPLKRKRMSDAGMSEDGDASDLRAELKRLRRETEEKDARLRQLEAAVMALQQSRR